MRLSIFCRPLWTSQRLPASTRRLTRKRRASPLTSAPFAALAFKIVTDPYVGKLAFFRVYSGSLEAGKTVLNTNKKFSGSVWAASCSCTRTTEKISAVVYSGDIAAAVGLKNTTTGDTL